MRYAPWLAAIALALVVLRAATAPLADVDVGWIAAASHGIPRTNAFSFAAPDHPWVMHEWLFGQIYGAGYRLAGLRFFAAVSVVATLALGAVVLRRMPQTLPGVVFGTALFAACFDRLTSARPIGVITVLPALVVVLAFRPLDRARMAILVLLELAWTNLHGSFPLGLFLLAGAAMEQRTRRHAFTLVLAGVATLVNPYGLALHRLVLDYALGRGETIALVHAHVLEYAPIWRRAWFEVVSPLEMGVLVAIAVLAARARGVRGLLAFALVLAACLQARHACFAVVAALLVAPSPVALPRPWLLLPAVVAALAIAAPPSIDASLGGEAFASLVRDLPDRARVFVPFRDGGLVLLLAGDRGVTTFYDSRNDPYPPGLVRIGLELKDGVLPAEGLTPLLRRSGAEYAIVPSKAHVEKAKGDPRWAALAVLEPNLDGRVLRAEGGWLLVQIKL